MHRSDRLSRSLLSFALIAIVALLPLFLPSPVASATEPVLVRSFQKAYDVNWRDSAVINGVFFFIADDGIHGAELWRSDGTPDGTRLVKDIRPGAAGADLSRFHVVGDTLFFVADDGVHGRELWRSDGTTEGTFMVEDVRVGSEGSLSWFYDRDVPMLVLGETLFFVADDGIHGRELWRSDATTPGARLVRDIRPGAESAFIASYGIQLVAMNGALYFFASSAGLSSEVWRSDGTTAGTFRIGSPGTRGRLIVHGNTLFIATPYGLWKSDGTPAGTVVIRDDICASDSPGHFAVMGDALFFVGGPRPSSPLPSCGDYELMQSDGTPEGTFMVKNIAANPWSGGSLGYYTFLTVVDNTLFFNADDGVHGRELWKSDGTTEGTVLVKDIYPGVVSSLYPVPFAVMDRTLFFVTGHSLWKSDGTAEGTVEVRGAGTGLPFGVKSLNMPPLHSTLFFNAEETFGSPKELWRTDGTTEGTIHVLPEPAFAHAAICGQAFITSRTGLYVLLLDANRCTISGRVTDSAGRGVAGATVQTGDRSATTDADGFYTLSGLPPGTYTLTATLSSYQITPVSRTVTVSSDVSGQDFSATPLTYRISGRVTDSAGRGVAGATVQTGERSATTDADGFYTLSDLPTGDYTLTVSKSGCTIAPAQRTVTVPPDGVNQDFNAVCLTERVVLPLIVR